MDRVKLRRDLVDVLTNALDYPVFDSPRDQVPLPCVIVGGDGFDRSAVCDYTVRFTVAVAVPRMEPAARIDQLERTVDLIVDVLTAAGYPVVDGSGVYPDELAGVPLLTAYLNVTTED